MPLPKFPLGVTAVMLPELDFAQQLRLCREVGVTHYSLRPRIIPDDQRDKPFNFWGNHKYDLTPARLVKEGRQIRKMMEDAGVTPFGTGSRAATSDSDEVIKEHLEGAALVGAGRVRVAPASYPQGPFDYPAYVDGLVARYQQIVALAKPMQLKIVIEMHCLAAAASPALALNLCRHFDPKDLGTIFDLPNFSREGATQPNLAIAVIGKWIDHCHVGGFRRIAGSYDANGFRQPQFQFCPVTESDLYIPGYLQALADAGIVVPLIIEDFTDGVPASLALASTAAALRRLFQ